MGELFLYVNDIKVALQVKWFYLQAFCFFIVTLQQLLKFIIPFATNQNTELAVMSNKTLASQGHIKWKDKTEV